MVIGSTRRDGVQVKSKETFTKLRPQVNTRPEPTTEESKTSGRNPYEKM